MAEQSDAIEQARQAALRLLTHRRRGTAELRRRLLEDGYAAETVEPVLAVLTRAGLLDDATFVEAYIHDGMRLRHRGRYRLRRELLELGLDEELVEAALERELSPAEEADLADRLAAARAERLRDLPTPTARRRLAAFLERRGLPLSLIRPLLDRYLPWSNDADD